MMNYQKQRITIYLPEEMVRQTDEITNTTGLTRNAIITIAVKSLIQQKQVVIGIEGQRTIKNVLEGKYSL